MKAAALSFMFCLVFLAAQTNAWARDAVLPAGTLLQCTLDEPNFSSATASVGDPVLCYPHGLYFFGQIVFPRGTYIVGHLADDKEPGHFWGKGDLHLEFDRIGLPSADVPLSAKIISVSGGYRVDKEGKIIGKGHAKRDVVEWMFPPLWPWKIITLPARGPRPVLKGETRVTLRLMDDVLVPDAASYRRFGQLVDPGTSYAHPALYLKPPQRLAPPSAITGPQLQTISWQPQGGSAVPQPPPPIAPAPANDSAGWRKFGPSGAAVAAPAAAVSASAQAQADDDQPQPATETPGKAVISREPAASADPAADGAVVVDDLPVSKANPQIVTTPVGDTAAAASAPAPVSAATVGTPAPARTAAIENAATAAPTPPTPKPQLTLFALQAGTVYAVTDYWRNEDRLEYVLTNGKEGQVNLSELDWKTTTQLNVERNVKVTLRDGR